MKNIGSKNSLFAYLSLINLTNKYDFPKCFTLSYSIYHETFNWWYLRNGCNIHTMYLLFVSMKNFFITLRKNSFLCFLIFANSYTKSQSSLLWTKPTPMVITHLGSIGLNIHIPKGSPREKPFIVNLIWESGGKDPSIVSKRIWMQTWLILKTEFVTRKVDMLHKEWSTHENLGLSRLFFSRRWI